jgi:hypothetical protein
MFSFNVVSKQCIEDKLRKRREISIYNETTTLRSRIYFTFNREDDRRLDPKHWIVPLEKNWLTESIDIVCKELCVMGWLTYVKSGRCKKYLFIFFDYETQNKFLYSEVEKQQFHRRRKTRTEKRKQEQQCSREQVENEQNGQENPTTRNIRRIPIHFHENSVYHRHSEAEEPEDEEKTEVDEEYNSQEEREQFDEY